MLIGTRTSAPDAQEAVVQARLDYQAARDHMVAAINKDYMASAKPGPDSLVFPQFACPDCGNRDMDSLIFGPGIRVARVTCQQCGCPYTID